MNFDPPARGHPVRLLDRTRISAYFENVMISRERVRLAMAGMVPDRVPVMCQMSIGHMLLQTGVSPSVFWNSGREFARGLAALRGAYAFDGILVSLHGHDPDWEKKYLDAEDGGRRGGHCLEERRPDGFPARRPADALSRARKAAGHRRRF